MAEAKATTTTKKAPAEPKADCVEAKLLEIQTRLFVPKEQKNEFGKYNYRSCEDIEKQVKPLCKEFNCVLRFWESVESFEGRLFVKSHLQLFDIDSKTNVMAYGWAEIGDGKKGMDPAQLIGACTSYARKYAMAGLFLIDNEKDADATNKHGKEEPETISADQINAINAELERTGVGAAVILDSVKKKSLELLTQADYESIMKRLSVTSDK